MAIDPRTPVIIGVAQVSRPAPDLASPDDPVALMANATREAIADCGGAHVGSAVDLVAVVGGLFSYRDPGALVAREAGVGEVATMLTTWGGQTPIALIDEVGRRIRAGRVDVAVVTGGETNATRRALKKAATSRPHRSEADDAGAEPWGPTLDMGSEVVRSRGGDYPRNTYAVLDSAIRARRGESLDEARNRAARLWAGFAAVAATNPHAADRSGAAAEQISEPSPSNRMVSWPYTKAMCANNQVDQAGSLILASSAAADRLGVPIDRRVYPCATYTASDTDSLLDRADVSLVPALAAIADDLTRDWGDIDDFALLDLYGCFPSIVTLTCESFRIDTDRALTVTGGLGFMGAPLNFAAGQSLIAMVQRLRADPGALGLVQGNGGHASKHAVGVYSTEPGDISPGPTSARASEPYPEADPDATTEVVIDGVTVEFDQSGPHRAIALCRSDDGRRSWATSREPSIMTAFMSKECVGLTAEVSAGTIAL